MSCVVSWVSGSVQVKAERNWQSGWSGMVKKGIFEVNNGEMRGLGRYGRKECVGVRNKWMGRDHRCVDQAEILHQPVVS